mmetsp:Transcript_23960/g.26591  ORF Transcript_23960/g.26591 Transcript_23960/m.26591 type:complete len:428 (+) Transcript_23960:88-1371(+)
MIKMSTPLASRKPNDYFSSPSSLPKTPLVRPDSSAFADTRVFSEKKIDKENRQPFKPCPEAPAKSPVAHYNTPGARPLTQTLRDRFEFVQRIGEGAFSQVYRVREKKSGQEYALKGLKRRFPRRSDIEQAKKEFHTGRMIGPHPNCLRYFEYFTNDWENIYILTELCHMSMDNYMKSVLDKIPEEKLWRFLADMALGVAHIHSKSLLHMDIKPANVLIGNNEVLKIADFGLTISKSEWERDLEGDKYYLAPELLRVDGILVGGASDIFSLGIMMLEMACNLNLTECPWQDLRAGMYPPQLDDPERVSPELSFLIKAMLHPNPSERPTAQQLLEQPMVKKYANTSVGRRAPILTPQTNRERYCTHPPDSAPVFPTGNWEEMGFRRPKIRRKSFDNAHVEQGEEDDIMDDVLYGPKNLLLEFDQCDDVI